MNVTIAMIDVNVGAPLNTSIGDAPKYLQDQGWIDARLAELSTVCEAIHDNTHDCYGHANPAIVVAPECFFGYGLCRMRNEWKSIKNGLKDLSKTYRNVLFVPGTAKKVDGSTVYSASRVTANSSKVMNVYKLIAAGPVDMALDRSKHWKDSLRENSNGKTRNKKRSNICTWRTLRVGVEICNDARYEVLKNDKKRGLGLLPLVVWVSRGCYLGTFAKDVNTVGPTCFPVRNGGHLIHCGGAPVEKGYFNYEKDGDSGTLNLTDLTTATNSAFGHHLGVYKKNDEGVLSAVAPDRFLRLMDTDQMKVKAVIWRSVDL